MSRHINIRENGAAQLVFKHKLLSKPFIFTWTPDDFSEPEASARNYADHLQSFLSQGIVPANLLTSQKSRASGGTSMATLFDDYLQYNSAITKTDIELCQYARNLVPTETTTDCDYIFVEKLVRKLKLEKRLTPGSIRKRIDILGRVVDFHFNRAGKQSVNAFRSMPKGYSIYNPKEVALLTEKGIDVPTDVKRDRSLSVAENAAVERALAGENLGFRQRALAPDPEFSLLYGLISIHGLRLREAFTLRRNQVDLDELLINVAGTKGHRGEPKPRVTPIRREFVDRITEGCDGKFGTDLLFPSIWTGDDSEEELKRTQMRLTSRFKSLFGVAGVEDCTEHDLRHYATVKWVLIRRKNGDWLYHYAEIQEIMGWESIAMVTRYASMRGDSNVNKLREVE